MENETARANSIETNQRATAIERLMFREIAGTPVVIFACGFAAILFGSLVAFTAGS